MLTLTLNGRDYELATSLRVVYALKDISHAASLQEAINSITRLDLDGQIALLYAAYKAGGGKNDNSVSQTNFADEVLDNLGIFAITDKINALADGLLYTGLTPEEKESKKAAAEAAAAATATGAVSSVEDIN